MVRAIYNACRGRQLKTNVFFPCFNLSFAGLFPSAGKKRFPHHSLTRSLTSHRFLGDDGTDEYQKSASTSSRSSARKPTTTTTTTVTSQEQLLRERFRIYFPTDRTVSQSRGGRNVSCDPRVIHTARPTNPDVVSNHISFFFTPITTGC